MSSTLKNNSRNTSQTNNDNQVTEHTQDLLDNTDQYSCQVQAQQMTKSLIKKQSQSIECTLCSTKYLNQQMINFTKCSHKYCLDCSTRYMKQKTLMRIEIKCPQEDCEAVIDLQRLQSLDEQLLQTIRQTENIINEDEDRKQQNVDIQKQEDNFQYLTPKKQISNELTQYQSLQIKNSQQIQMKKSLIKSFSSQKQKSPSVQQNQKIQSVIDSNQFFHEKTIPNKSVLIIKQEIQDNLPNVIFPEKLFNIACNKIWSNKWSKFFLMFPISIIIVLLYLVGIILWSICITIYFTIVWLIIAPAIWSLHEIWMCFSRSFENVCFRIIMLVISLIVFPIIQIFFYFLTMALIIYFELYKQDMQQLLQGRYSLIMSQRKHMMNKSIQIKYKCHCIKGQTCESCQNRNTILCFVF